MAKIRPENEKDIVIEADMADLQVFVDEAVKNFDTYKEEIAIIYEKMPKFDYKYFCFYAYATYRLLEATLDFDTSQVGHIRVEAPDEFFYAYYGMIAALHTQRMAKEKLGA